ncbi:hypothetical protein F9C07_2593 [Aspergillus flavus]|uniref:Uncharacterized protein n=1 Tax=Aspergillus flavus (strain ATCC 200026 / FGSC A1120 / IAM 13836 / NRRL 3357 / JCM 12722 / SRRC 167) TaxID=332952 RepID=A0A7U2QRY2_ASPFN|nr:hypothetical protein F9C07_2593 [Aspergillus flavus]
MTMRLGGAPALTHRLWHSIDEEHGRNGYFDRLSTFLPVACLPGSLFIAVAKRTRERERKGKIQIASSSHGSTTQSNDRASNPDGKGWSGGFGPEDCWN